MNLIEILGTQSIVLYQLYFTYSFLTYKNQYALIMVITILINIFINIAIKHYLMEWAKNYNHTLPIIGNLCRPIDIDCKNISTLGYGTPSNHSQIACFIAAFYYFYYRNTDDYSIVTTVLLSTIALMIMFTRYTSKNHSIPQIILGSTFGISLAYILNWIIHLFIS